MQALLNVKMLLLINLSSEFKCSFIQITATIFFFLFNIKSKTKCFFVLDYSKVS